MLLSDDDIAFALRCATLLADSLPTTFSRISQVICWVSGGNIHRIESICSFMSSLGLRGGEYFRASYL